MDDDHEIPDDMTHRESMAEERWARLGFKPQKEIFCNKYLPYAEILDDESAKLLATIKTNLGRAVALRDMNPGIGIYAARLLMYIKLYGLKFSKEDHIEFIKLCLEMLTIEYLEPAKINKIAVVLIQLLSKSRLLSPDDLQIEWRPLYELSNIYLNKSSNKGDLYRFFPSVEANLTHLINLCAIYFPKSATQEILDEFLPRLQPLDIGKPCSVFEMLGVLAIMPHGHEIWVHDFMKLWDTYQNPVWATDMMNLISTTAGQTIGKIDWEPYIPVMFSRILRAMDLPVSYKSLKSARNPMLYNQSSALWIVSVLGPKSSAQTYLSKFMNTIESYLHPANNGKWVALLIDFLVHLLRSFFDRLVCERYKKHPWKEPIPEESKLTENCITVFVECIKPVAFQAMYSRGSRLQQNEVCKIFKHLSDLRPALIIPDVIDRVYSTMDSLTEPHKMTAAINIYMSVSRALLGDKTYTESRTHVIPIFFAMLPGIDPNDINKTATVLQCLTSFAISMIFIDCSKAGQYEYELTEDERLLCEQTADFHDFVLQYLDRIFVLIDASASEVTRLEQSDADNYKSRIEMFSEHLVQSASHAIFSQCSREIVDSAAQKVLTYTKTHLLEPTVAAPLLGSLVRIFSRVHAAEFLRNLVPYLTDEIQRYFDDHDDLPDLDKQRDELLYLLTMLLNTARGDPKFVAKYVDEYMRVVDYVFTFKCKLANRLATALVLTILNNLSSLQTLDTKSVPECFTKPLSEMLPIRHWGEKCHGDPKINWYYPDDNVRALCEKIVQHYLIPILKAFDDHVEDRVTLDRDTMLKNLEMIIALIRCGNLLPNWDTEQPIDLIETVVDRAQTPISLGFDHHHVKMPDGSNVRLAVVKAIDRLQAKILETSEDDIKSLRTILSLWERLAFRRHCNSGFDTQLKGFITMKQLQDYRLTKRKRDVRTMMGTRVIMQQDCRDEMSMPWLTESHKIVIMNLFKLSISHYSAVRGLAQLKLTNMLAHFPFSYKVIIPSIVETLRLDCTENHEAFKGALYVIGYNRRNRLIVKHNWDCIESLWIALLESKMSEKPSVIKLFDGLSDYITNEFPTLSIKIEISPKITKMGIALIPTDVPKPTVEEIEAARKKLADRGDEKLATYNRIIQRILQILHNNQLHWRYSLLASNMIFNLVHPQVNYPAGVATHFVHNLIHESLRERKVAIRIMNYVFRQYKRRHIRIVVDPFEVAGVKRVEGVKLLPGMRDDNRWLQYDVDKVPKTQEEWDKPRFVYKQNGYFGWTPEFEVYAPTSQQPKLDRTVDEMTDIERVIFTFFTTPSNIDKLIEYWSLEEKKGKDKFNRSRFYMIKCLCNAFGDTLLPQFMRHLPRLVEDKSVDGHHRCAAEIMAGYMRGAKHWSFAKVEELYRTFTPLLQLALQKITVETDVYWGTCFATAAEHMDPYRQWWLHELLLDEPLQETTSFIDCSRLYCLQGAFNQHVWRLNTASHRLLTYLRPYLDHPFQNIRERIGSILINLFEGDLQFPGSNPPESPLISDFITELKPRFDILLTEQPKKQVEPMVVGDNGAQGDTVSEFEISVRLFKTIAQWLIGIINRCSNGNEKMYFDLLPIACRLEKYDTDQEVVELSTTLIAMLSQALTLPDRVDAALVKINEVSLMSSWSARLTVIDMLQVLIFHNMAVFISREEWIQQVQTIVLRLLEDNVLEVREKAGEVLCGLLHCAVLPATDKLLEQFKLKCRTKITIRRGNRIGMSCAVDASTEGIREANAVRIRHTGVLGLCAFISAYPYDVPDFVPNVFEHLGAHLNDPQPIPSTIRKTMGDFKRTHHDNWETHQLKFTEDQLAVLSDLTVPPSYYA